MIKIKDMGMVYAPPPTMFVGGCGEMGNYDYLTFRCVKPSGNDAGGGVTLGEMI